jgi:plastocyanin
MRKIAIIITALALPLTLAACGGDDHDGGAHGDMPMDRDGMPMDGSMPMDRDGMPMDREGMPMDRDGMPMDRDGMPMDRDGMPMGGDMPGHDGAGGHGENSPMAPDARLVDMTGRDLRFDPATLTAREGENIGIMLRSVDLEHDLVIDEFDAHVYADRGQTGTGGFTASRAGRFTYYCSIPGHREAGMEGTLVVEAG